MSVSMAVILCRIKEVLGDVFLGPEQVPEGLLHLAGRLLRSVDGVGGGCRKVRRQQLHLGCGGPGSNPRASTFNMALD